MSLYNALKPLPRDNDGYVAAFTTDELPAAKQFFDDYGVVVVKDLLSPEECTKSVEGVWDEIKQWVPDVDPMNPKTWDKFPPMSRLNFIGDLPVLQEQFCNNRQNPKIYDVFRTLMEDDDLIVGLDRSGMMRPTKGIKLCDGTSMDKPEWKTSEFLHIDYNPLNNCHTTFGFMPTPYAEECEYDKYDKIRVQGILAFVDCGVEDGGFHCVPGFHKIATEWMNESPHHLELCQPPVDGKWYNLSGKASVTFDKEMELYKHVEKVSVRKGSLVVWNGKLAHGSYPNDSGNPRVVQYMRMAHRDDPAVRPVKYGVEQQGAWGNAHILKPTFPDGFEVTELGKRLFSLPPYDGEPRKPTGWAWLPSCVLM